MSKHLRAITEFKRPEEAEAYLEAIERHVFECFYGTNQVYKGVDMKELNLPLARAWQKYLSLRGDTRANQVKGIVHCAAWVRFKQGKEYAQDYQDLLDGKFPEKITALERDLARTVQTAEDMRLVRDFR